MYQIAYTSVASNDLASGEVFKIIERSAHNNAKAGLTGFLIFSNNRFFQVIEGEPADIENLMQRLESDPRHHSIKIVHRTPITRRSFPKWRMKRVIAPVGEAAKADTLIPDLECAPPSVKRAADKFLEPAFT